MKMVHQSKRNKAVNQELLLVEKQKKRMAQAAMKAQPAAWKTALESKIPQKVYTGLESAFCKGFSLVFQQGRAVIEKGCRKEDIQANYDIQDFAVQVKGNRKELRKLHRQAKQADLIKLAVTTVEGIGLGALGIGMPDIVLFLGTLFKGIYETALHYGFDYASRQEQLLILKMMAVSLITGADWASKNSEVDEMLYQETAEATDEDFQSQIKATASAFAVDMLLLKFVQGLPVVGILGGVANPVYYRKVMNYVQLKYRKRYLLKQRGGVPFEDTLQ